MRRLIQRIREGEDRGAALALVAASMVVLMGMAAFGTDLAWFYLNTSRVQRAADAAALGGVIWLPGDTAAADATAIDIALRNGYDNSLPDVDVDPAPVTDEPNQLQVTVTDVVPTFFAQILGFDDMTISRTAIAEYIPPLRLGSPENQFGNSCDPEEFGPCGGYNFWANIHGQWTDSEMGDAYGPACNAVDNAQSNKNDNPSCDENDDFRPNGYLYGIESGSSFTVEFVDLAFHNIANGSLCPGNQEDPPVPDGCTSDWRRTGDHGCETWGPSTAPECGPTMRITIYAPDPTPLDISDNTPLCTATVPPEPQVPEGGLYSWARPDGQGCWSQSGAGIYVVQVQHVDPGTVLDRSGLNRYSIRSTTGNLFALGDFSIYNNAVGSTTAFFLAEVPTYYHGKTFVVELFDAGESNDPGTLQVIDPSGQPFDAGECRLYERNSSDDDWVQFDTIPAGNPCQEGVGVNEYHDRWLKFEMDLPPEYACTDCWWQMNYSYPTGVNDTTTWLAYMIGNPIHLVE